MVYARIEADGTVKSSVDKFYSQEVLQKMKEAFEGFDDLILCPVSNWVGERATQSPVLKQYPIRTVLNGIDTDIFHYREKEALVLRE